MNTQFSTYQTRPIRFLETAEYAGWRIKVYGIRYQGETAATMPDAALVAQAKTAVLSELPDSAEPNNHAVGFLIIHQGQERNWLLLDWWFGQDIVKQKLFSSPLDDPSNITSAEPDLLACVWELAVHAHERQAWVDHVLNNPNGPDLQAYLDSQLSADV